MAKAALLIAGSVVVLALVLLVALLIMSPGRPRQLTDEDGAPLPNSISEKTRVTINGVKQGMFIKGEDASNPVLLYLHGGMPDHFLTQRYPTGLEKHFTVVWWEQRGSGLSYGPDVPVESITPDQLVSDTLALTDHLRERFGQERIYLMGHSGGTFIGLQAAERSPESYHAYIAIAQMTDQLESERLAYEFMLERYHELGDTRMARRLERAPVTGALPLPDEYESVRDVAMHDLGVGTIREMRSIVTGLLVESFLAREYTLGEKIGMWRGKVVSGRRLWNEQLSTDLRSQVRRLEIPVYFVHGSHDHTVSYPLAKAYLGDLEAPAKGFYTFPESAHSPLFEDPARLERIITTDVLAGGSSLADGDK